MFAEVRRSRRACMTPTKFFLFLALMFGAAALLRAFIFGYERPTSLRALLFLMWLCGGVAGLLDYISSGYADVLIAAAICAFFAGINVKKLVKLARHKKE